MRTDRDLEQQLVSIDRRGYPAYKELRGVYDFGDFQLSIDHVQGDPFAAPSQFSVYVSGEESAVPPRCCDARHRRIAAEDALVRRFAAEAARASHAVGGSGKSGYLGTSVPGPEVLERSACELDARGGVIVRFEVGLPAHGRTIDGRGAARMLLDAMPACVERALMLDDEGVRDVCAAADLADDQQAVREALRERGLVAFVADGSVLPRASGVSSRPLAGARPFCSPEALRVTIDVPHRGTLCGMGIRRGVTLIVGGGYHGKSTLLKALQEGVYNHVEDDGRAFVITDDTAVKLRAEDGRQVRSVDISPFINNLPNGRDTHAFTTADASGSTSQAAGTVEALEAGGRVLLIDEDTSATNFMVRDELMEAVVAPDREPITPFSERVRALWEQCGVSCVLVVGSSGAFFPLADTVIQMDAYEAHDITDRVRTVLEERGILCAAAQRGSAGMDEGALARDGVDERMPVLRTAAGRGRGRAHARGGRGGDARAEHLKVRMRDRKGFLVGRAGADLRLVEQLVDAEQTASLAQMTRLVLERGMLDGTRSIAAAVDAVYRAVDEQGWDALDPFGRAACGLALPRRQEIFAALNRLRLDAEKEQ